MLTSTPSAAFIHGSTEKKNLWSKNYTAELNYHSRNGIIFCAVNKVDGVKKTAMVM